MEHSKQLTIRGLTAGYQGAPVIHDISLDLQPGEILCIVGESGCGKTTFLKTIMGTFRKVELLGGQITYDNTSITDLAPVERMRFCTSRIGLIVQDPSVAFNPIRSYRKQFIETLKAQNIYDPSTLDHTIDSVFAKLGLEDTARIMASRPYEMSGGMNQRIAIALSLIMGQSLLLADEPTSSLDATSQKQVADELLRIRNEFGIGQIIVTHNLALAYHLADKVGVMANGRIVEYGPATLLTDPQHEETRRLLDSVPKRKKL